jgi:hypothetical protein
MDNDAHGLFEGPMTPAEAWLGERKNWHNRESFPEGTLNDKQVRAVLKMEEGSRRVQNLSETMRPAILKVTEKIIEVHTDFGGSWPNTQALALWLDADGKFLAAVEEKYEGPRGVHKPGDTFRKWAVAYRRTPDMGGFAKSEEVTYDHMWGLGNDGAMEQTRQFIRNTWVEA